MGRTPCCSKVGLRRGAWSSDEDQLLINYIQTHGEGQWRALPSKAGLLRCGKSCRLRWMNYLRPDIKRGNFTSDEDDVIIRLRSLHGNRWSLIAAELPGRTDNDIKNYWNAHLRKVAYSGDHLPKAIKKKVYKKKKSDDLQKDDQSENIHVEVGQTFSSSSAAASSSSSSSSSASLSKNENIDDGVGKCASSSSTTIDHEDIELDFSWLTPFLEVEGTSRSSPIDGQEDDEGLLVMDGCDLLMSKDDEKLMLDKLYHEYLDLLNLEDGDDPMIN